MERNTLRRNPLRTALMTACLGLAFAGMANADIPSQATETVYGEAPTVATAVITGTPTGPTGKFTTGDVLTANFTVADVDQDPADLPATEMTVQWTSNGAPVGTLGSKTYTVQATDKGKSISFSLVPRTDQATTDPWEGARIGAETVGSDGSGKDGKVDIPGEGALLSIAVTGVPKVGTTLTAVATCDGTCNPAVQFQWRIETAIGSGVFQDIPGATSNTYVVVRTDQKRHITVVGKQ